MRRIVLSLVTILAVVAMVAGSTKAVFSDTESITGNSLATGTLNLTLNHSAGKPFSITGAYPGYMSGWAYMDIFNGPYPGVPGQLPFEAKMSLNKTAGDEGLWGYVRINLKTSGWDSDCANGDGGERTIHDGLINTFVNGTTVSGSVYWHLADEADGHGGPDNIRPGYSERVCQRVGVDNSAPNTVQGKSVTFNEVVDAVQDND